MPRKEITGGLVLGQYRDDPCGFAREVLGVRLWEGQERILRAVQESGRVGVRSGHKVGKSRVAAIAALWWIYTRDQARALMLAPTGRQVRNVLYREVRSLHRAELGGTLFDLPDRGLVLEDGRELVGFTSDAPENLAGWSGPNMFFVVDEASGLDEMLYEVILGNMAGGAKMLLISNPTKQSGFYFDAFHSKSRFWNTLHISSEESPNVTGIGEQIPGLATPAWIDEMREEWGEDSPLFQVRVKGAFPTQASNSVIGLEDVDSSVARWRAWKEQGAIEGWDPLELGVDPARFGEDQSVIVARRGMHVIAMLTYRNLDGPALAEKVQEIARSKQRVNEIPIVRVDVIGIGASVVDVLKRDPHLNVCSVNVAEASTSAQYYRKRDQLWFTLRDWLRSGGCIPDDMKLMGELVAPTYMFTEKGSFKVESKDDMRSRLKRSPDRADALGLSVFSRWAGIPTMLHDGVVFGERRI